MYLYLDTETTGFSAARGDEVVEIAIVDEYGNVLLDTLVEPSISIPRRATEVHGITDSMVYGKPSLEDILPEIDDIIAGHQLVIYNKVFDVQFFDDGLSEASHIHCAMKKYKERIGPSHPAGLADAADHVGHVWSGPAHRALADTLACKSVWEWCIGR